MDLGGPPPVLAMAHLVVLALWGGVVATEAVIELYPFRHREGHAATIRLHYWIDLVVEAPLVLAVAATGIALLLSIDDVTPRHLVKLGFGAAAIAVNLLCIAIVVRRGRRLERSGEDPRLWRASRTVLACFAVGLLCAAVAGSLGFGFALDRLR
ncbi:MAG: hypothetical protein MUE90_02655 [Thermoanaerobaculales bacterium]|nr:hypothetical protein [Thermoanaerobaculales bacterium]